MRAVPAMMMECDDKENLPNETDYEDLPVMYRDDDEEEEELDEDEEEVDEEEEEEEEDDDDEDDEALFTSRWFASGLFGVHQFILIYTSSNTVLPRHFALHVLRLRWLTGFFQKDKTNIVAHVFFQLKKILNDTVSASSGGVSSEPKATK